MFKSNYLEINVPPPPPIKTEYNQFDQFDFGDLTGKTKQNLILDVVHFSVNFLERLF